MAWFGYFQYDGTEIVNLSRVTTYARNFGLNWLRTDPNSALGPILGETYNSPMVDDAPWMDADEDAGMEFYGVYPLEVTGLEDSTVSAAVTESVLDGGVVNRPRRATRSVVFSLALLGSSESGVEYGMRWLKNALSGAPCQGLEDCTGSQLCYLSSEPFLPTGSLDPTECLDPLLRTLHKVTITTGPIITSKFTLPSGGYAWTVSLTAVAGDPFEFMVERPLVEGFLSGTPTIYVDPAYPPALTNHSWVNAGGVVTQEYSCTPATYRPLYDPDCPLVLPPPGVPSVAVSCFDFPDTFTRRYFTIPEEMIPLWGSTVPIITFKTGLAPLRNMRLRFYADVLGTGNTEQDPCAYCGDIVFSYIPSGSTLVFDGTERIVSVQTPGQPLRRGDAVVFKTDGTPFEWPELSCGFSYLVAVDLPSTATPLLMTTSDFEDGTTTNWTAINSATMANSNSQAHTGTRSLRLTMPSGAGTPGAVRNSAITVTAGQRVTVSAWIYMVGGTTTSFAVQATGVTESDIVAVPVTVAGKWQEATYSFTAATAGTLNVYVLAPGTTGTGDIVYVDDVQAYSYDTTMSMDMSLVGKVVG